MTTNTPSSISSLDTPALLVDIRKVERNATTMAQRCHQMGVSLRPHMKTHKTIEAAEIMTNGTKRHIVVSTLAEAEFYASHGFDDVLFAQPLTQEKVPRCAQIVAQLEEFHVMIDSTSGLDAISSRRVPGKQWSVFIKVDCGYGRAGVSHDSADGVQLVQYLVSTPGVKFAGLYAHCGDSYNADSPEEVKAIGHRTAQNILAFAAKLKKEGIECPTVSIGSTPTCSQPADTMAQLTEVHPGNYIFYDVQQSLLGSCQLEDIAVQVMTRVIGHYPGNNHLLVDCGWTALSLHSLGQLPTGFGIIDGHPELKLSSMTQEVGKVHAVEGTLDFDKYPIGTVLKILPYHACATACMHPKYYVHSGEAIVAVWKPCRGW
ncbi:D-serine dehydratase-like isoform X1 [Branchiostoma floridae x Branchiostoma japonicum]